MSNQSVIEGTNKSSILKRQVTVTVVLVIVIALLLCVIGFGLKQYVFSESKTTKIGFEDIGELATQAAYCTEVSFTDKSQVLYGVKIPFTQSKYVYSYDVVVKAGYEFSEIEWDLNDKTIEVRLPVAKVLSRELKLDSFKVYHESESIFTPIKLEDNNDALEKLEAQAETDAIANGLLENAKSNAELILTGFFSGSFDMNEYSIKFVDA